LILRRVRDDIGGETASVASEAALLQEISATENASHAHAAIAERFDGYNRGLHWERTCAEVAPIATMAGDSSDPSLATAPASSQR
jgi:hypothetical protein